MITNDDVTALYGRDVYDSDGDKIGSLGQVWADPTGQPAWASVKTGFFGTNESLVPLDGADVQGDRVVVAFDKSRVKDAPNIDASHDEPLDPDGVGLLYQYYGLTWQAGGTATTGSSTDASYATGAGYSGGGAGGYTDVDAGRSTDDAMTRSEERLDVGTERQRVGTARLRKYVVTERQQVEVPVTREEVRLERVPVTDANAGSAYDGPELTESEHEVTLHAERPVVQTETVPVERVRLGKETVTEQETVGADVRKERIEADLPDEQGRRDIG
jgi:uncharacterized protein (TIGR02271 family)